MALAVISYLVIPALCLLGIKRRRQQEDLLGKDATLAIRGVGMLFIVFTHMVKGNLSITTYFYYVSGMVGVALCFLVSGYGLHVSYVRKQDYLQHFWVPKIFRLILPFLAAYGIYLIDAILRGKVPDVESIIRDLIAVTFAGTTLWYLKIQFLMYVVFYVTYRFVSEKRLKIAVVFVITGVYIAIAFAAGMDSFWYNTCLFFPLGLALAEYQNGILAVVRKNGIFVVSCCVFTFVYAVLYVFGRMNMDWLIDNVYMVSFSAVMLWMVLNFSNLKVLTILGKYSIEIYLVHTVIGGHFSSSNPASYILLPLVSVLLGIPIHWLSDKVNGLLTHKLKR